MALRNFSANAAQATLSAGVTSSATTFSVSATTGFPATPFILAVDAGAAAQELVLVTNVAGTNLTVTRGYDSTVAVAHDTGAVVAHSHGAIDFREANAHVNATSSVHGTTSPVVGTQDTQTLTNKTVNLGSNTLTGTKAQFNTALTDGDFATLDGTETLTNKTLTAPAATGSLASFGGARTAWSPTVTATTGAFTSVSASGRYGQVGKDVHWSLTITITDAGTAAGYIEVPLPVAAFTGAGHVGSGRVLEGAPSKAVQVFLSTAAVARVSRYDDNTAIGTGYTLHLSGCYEAA